MSAAAGGPIVFISRFRVKPGAEAQAREMIAETVDQINRTKPGTVGFAGYLNADGSEMAIFHLFPDAAAMDRHHEGWEQRASTAYEAIEPINAELFGTPSQEALDLFHSEDRELMEWPQQPAGYLRLG